MLSYGTKTLTETVAYAGGFRVVYRDVVWGF